MAAISFLHFAPENPENLQIAGRLLVSIQHKKLPKRLPWTAKTAASLSSSAFLDCLKQHSEELQGRVIHDRDSLDYDYTAVHLLQSLCKPSERIQHMFLRVCGGIYGKNVEECLELYDLLSCKWCLFSDTILRNSGLERGYMLEGFVLQVPEDSIEGIYDAIKQCAVLSKYSSGQIGFGLHDIRATGTYISGTNGISNGLVPMLRVFDASTVYVDRGVGRMEAKGATQANQHACFIETHHADILSWLELKKCQGKDEMRAKNLVYHLVVSDLFLRRIEQDGPWSLFCPHEAPGLHLVSGEAFSNLYEEYERKARAKKVMKARDLWQAILELQSQDSTFGILFKDNCNQRSNHKHLGTIHCSDPSLSVVQFSSAQEMGFCNRAFINLSMFVKGPDLRASEDGKQSMMHYDFPALVKVVGLVTKALNQVLDETRFPLVEVERAAKAHRPLSISVMGLADTFTLMRLPFESVEALQLNAAIFEAIYYAACRASVDLARESGPHPSFPGSPASQGLLQFDLWGVASPGSGMWDWSSLKADLKQHGMKNSVLVALTPDPSSATILGTSNGVEPRHSNLVTTTSRGGAEKKATATTSICPLLVQDLQKLGLWTDRIRQRILASDHGSIQRIDELPVSLKNLYKTAWEIPGKTLMEMAASRGPYICQSQTLRIYSPSLLTVPKLTSMCFYAWKKGLKSLSGIMVSVPTSTTTTALEQVVLRKDVSAMFPIKSPSTLPNGVIADPLALPFPAPPDELISVLPLLSKLSSIPEECEDPSL